MVERLLSMQEAQGSIPCSSTFFGNACFHTPLVWMSFDFGTPGAGCSMNRFTETKRERETAAEKRTTDGGGGK